MTTNLPIEASSRGTVSRIGYSLGPLLSIQQILEYAKLADQRQNVDSLWVPESWGREAFLTLGAMAQHTKRAKLGTSIVSIYSRTPATVAMAATTLDLVSENRTNIGIGASTPSIVKNWHGMAFDKPVKRMKEYIQCIRLIISGQRVNFNGEFFKLRDFKILHEPPRKKIPILVAAVKNTMLSLSVDCADGVLLYLRPLEELKRTVEIMKTRLRNNAIIKDYADKSFEIALVIIGAVSNREPERARERAAKTLAFYLAVGEYYRNFISENGFKGEVESITTEYRKHGAVAAAKIVTDKMLDSLTISGTSEECLRSMQRFLSAGVTLPIVQVNPLDDTKSSIMEMLETF